MAGPWYLRSSDGNDGDDGLSWANACATMSGVLAKAVAAGDIIYVDDDHQESLAGDTTWTFPGTEGSPNVVIVVTTNTTTAVSSYNCTNQYFEGETNNAHIAIAGEVYFWGVCLKEGDYTTHVASSETVTLEKCYLYMDASTAIGVSADNSTLRLINTDVEVTAATGRFLVQASAGFTWRGGSLTGDTDAIVDMSSDRAYIEMVGLDLSSIDGGTIVDVAAGDEGDFVRLKGIKVHASNAPTLISAGGERDGSYYMDMWDESDQNNVYKFRKEFQYGYAMEETTLTVSGKGLYDGTNEFSVKMVSRASPTCTLYDPWRYHLCTKRVNVNAKTCTAYILVNGNGGQPAALEDDEVWLEVVYPDDSTAQYMIENDRIATPTTTPAAQADDSGRWQNETNGREQKLEVTIADGDAKEGPVEFYICLAKDNTTIYVCPEVDVA